MGVVLDSTVFITAERTGSNAADIVRLLETATREQQFFASATTLSEVAVGLVRAQTERQRFVDDIRSTFEFLPLTAAAAFHAGILRAMLQQTGLTTDLPDLLIAATALELDHAFATSNVRHFRRIPGLRVVEL